MSNIYNEYNNYWKNIRNYIEGKKKFSLYDIYDITFNIECKEINNIIQNGKYININNNILEKYKYFDISRHESLNENTINNYDLIIELGSGWGRNIFYYINKYNLENTKIISGEYTEEGCEAQKYIKNNFYKTNNLDIYYFDYNNSNDFFMNIEKKYNNILVLTFWSIEQITYLNDNFFNNLLNMGGNIKCIHIEPIGWQISENSLMKENTSGYRSYYNKNLYPILKELKEKNKINIDRIILDYHNLGDKGSCGTFIEWSTK